MQEVGSNVAVTDKKFFTQIIYTRSISDKRLSDIDFTDEPVVKHNIPDVKNTF